MSRWHQIEPGTITLPEQRAVHQYTTQQQRLHEDLENDDRLYDVRIPTSARRYHTTAPVTQEPTRVVVHDRRRAQQQQAPRPQQQAHPIQPQSAKRSHTILFLCIGGLLMLLLWMAGTALLSWWQVQQDDQQYGRPRTYQIDARVGHGDEHTLSHFIALNLNRHVVIIEFPGGDLTKEKEYLGPTLFGDGQDLAVITLTFKNVNGDGKPDMVVHIQGNQQVVFINDGTAFRPSTEKDVIHV